VLNIVPVSNEWGAGSSAWHECRLRKPKAERGGGRGFKSRPVHHTLNPPHSKQILNTLSQLKREQLAETTIKEYGRKLRRLDKHTNLDDPETIIEYLANKQAKISYLEAISNAYVSYARVNQIKWNKPQFRRTSQPPYIPTPTEIEQLIADAGTKYSLILSILHDTGLRPIELQRMKLKWLDLNRGLINVETAKYGNGRTLKLKPSTLAMLNTYLANRPQLELNDNVFPKVKSMRGTHNRNRARTANKLKNPNLLKISLKTFRHYFATMLYHKTKDILHVKQQLGHKRLENTLTYTHLINFQEDEYNVRTAKTIKEACQLVEAGFEYVTEMEGVKLFRKRK
jgi:integrase